MTCMRTLRTLGRYLPAGHPLNPGPGGSPSPASHSHFLLSTGMHSETQRSSLTLKVMK